MKQNSLIEKLEYIRGYSLGKAFINWKVRVNQGAFSEEKKKQLGFSYYANIVRVCAII